MEKTSLFFQSRQDLDRIAHVMDILAKFQMGQIADRVRLGEKLPIRLRRHRHPKEYKTPPERMRLMLEELGTTFIKFGQMLSTRADIIGPDYATELSKLQDHTKPFSGEQAKKIIEEELGRPVGQVFARFDEEPLASASIAQVHRATLKDGTKVVVKVQRPGIQATINEDLRIIHYLAHMASKYVPEVRKYDPEYLVEEFERSIKKELDFLREAKSAQRLKENFKGDRGIYIPEIYTAFCTRRVLTMEEVKGTPLSQIIRSNSKKFNRELIAHRFTAAFFKMVLEDGFYHADLHPGNILVMDNNRVCFLDYGRVGTIDKEVAYNLFRLALFTVENDVNGLISHLIRSGMLNEGSEADMVALKADLADVLDAYYSDNIRNIEIGHLLSDIVEAVSRYQFNRPREFAELTRALLILEGAGMQLSSSYNLAAEFEPYAKKIVPEDMNIHKISDIISNNIVDLEYLARTFPMALRRLMKKVDEGKLKVELEHKDLTYFSANLENIGNMLSTSMIIAAIIIGSALITRVAVLLGLFGFVVGVILAVLLLLRTILY